MTRISHFSLIDKCETFTQINVKTYVKGVKLKKFTPTSVIILEVAMDGSFFIATLAMHKRVKIGERS